MCGAPPPSPPLPALPSSSPAASHIIAFPPGNMRRLGEQEGEAGEMAHSLAHVIERQTSVPRRPHARTHTYICV